MAFLPASIVLCLNSLIPILIFTPILVYIYVYLEICIYILILVQNAFKHRTHRHQDLHLRIHLTYVLYHCTVFDIQSKQTKMLIIHQPRNPFKMRGTETHSYFKHPRISFFHLVSPNPTRATLTEHQRLNARTDRFWIFQPSGDAQRCRKLV